MSPLRLLSLAGMAALLLASCTAAPQPTASPLAADTNTPLPTLTQFIVPSATPLPTATLPNLDWPTHAAPTLMPFPLSEAGLQPTEPVMQGYPAAQAPIALSPFDHFYFTFPIANAHLGLYTPSQRYGVRQEAGTNRREPHLGFDVSLNAGTPVRAAGDGTIVWASYGQTYNSPYFLDDPYGISIVIRHNFGYNGDRIWTVYAHLSSVSVDVGQQVKQGELIGLTGNTGLSTGPHLHFEVRTGTNSTNFTYNPELWLAPPEGHGVLVGRVANERNQLLLNWLVEVRSLDTGELWTNYTYFTGFRLRSDPYYKENLVLTNLPAGRYEVAVPLYSIWWRTQIEIKPGTVTYFHYMGRDGYSFELPAEPPLVGVPD